MLPPNPAYSFLNTIKYTFADDTTTSDAMICLDHDHALLKPQVISTWMPSGVGSKPGKRVIFAETQVCTFTNVTLNVQRTHIIYSCALENHNRDQIELSNIEMSTRNAYTSHRHT